MNNDALIRRLMKTFLAEFEEHIQVLDHHLLALERQPGEEASAGVLEVLFRAAHSLKGASRAVNLEALEAVAHSLESIFTKARERGVLPSGDLFQLLFSAVDAMRDAHGRLLHDEGLENSPLVLVLPSLQAASVAPDNSNPGQPTAKAIESTPAPAAARVDPGYVRIASIKLDRMLELGGELMIARGRAVGCHADVDRLVSALKKWESEWRHDEKLLRQLQVEQRTEISTSLHDQSEILERNADKLRWMTRQLIGLSSKMLGDQKVLDQVSRPLEEEIRRARMVPFATACEGLQRMVRDLARDAGKNVGLSINGGETEVDRSVAEALRDPLLHLIRNAFVHGFEDEAARRAAGKPAHGTITISAVIRSGSVEIVVGDDGRGLDLVAIREQAHKRNLPIPDDDRDAARLVFGPGFSTSPTVTALAGRGVGLDVVRTAVEARRGSVDIKTIRGAGTEFCLRLPLNLTILPALLVRVGSQVYVFDNGMVQKVGRAHAGNLRTVEGRDMLVTKEGPLPIFSLANVLGQRGHEPSLSAEMFTLVVLHVGMTNAAFVVDEALAEQDVVVKSVGARVRAPSIQGATILPTGKVALILNAAVLMQRAMGHAPAATLTAAFSATTHQRKKRLLVVDDSVTTRTLVTTILESAGYDVRPAVDGMEAWQILQEEEPDLVVTDIEMPKMDGCSLTEAIRSSKRLRRLPVILVTALEADHDRVRGMEAGADAYLVKRSFDQSELIQTIEQLL